MNPFLNLFKEQTRKPDFILEMIRAMPSSYYFMEMQDRHVSGISRIYRRQPKTDSRKPVFAHGGSLGAGVATWLALKKVLILAFIKSCLT